MFDNFQSSYKPATSTAMKTIQTKVARNSCNLALYVSCLISVSEYTGQTSLSSLVMKLNAFESVSGLL